MTKIFCKCENVEVRGLEQKLSKNNNKYFVLYCENFNGVPFNVFIPNDVDVSDLKKGDRVDLDCVFTTGKYPKFDCVGVVKYE